MDDTLLDYEASLKALEKQRESLELVMQKMGAEWEESGAGIGWMGDNLYNNTTSNKNMSPPPLMSLMHSVTSDSNEPSHDYLQTLLNVNDKLLAESLASSSATTATCNYINYDTHDRHPHLLKASAFVSRQQQQQQQQQQDLPISPAISQDDDNDESGNTLQLASIDQFTPPITPD
ncbi:hypothetical protein HPULCUR_000948 [Helicostylum pulchrum]|uniref:Uncharacterized protein n=1 Tax=Helicostylum pulchrum TaxID=562976 RepID=A0ABP9XLA7_9FUNG